MDTFPDAVQSNLTPASVVRDHQAAAAREVIWTLVLVAVVLLLVGGGLYLLIQD